MSQFWRVEVQNQGVPVEVLEENLSLVSSGSWRPLASLGLWPHLFLLCLLCCVLQGGLSVDLGPTEIIQNGLFISKYLNAFAKTFILIKVIYTGSIGREKYHWGLLFSSLLFLKGGCCWSLAAVLTGQYPCRKCTENKSALWSCYGRLALTCRCLCVWGIVNIY